LINATASGLGSNADFNRLWPLITVKDMFADTDNSVKFSAPHRAYIHGMIVIGIGIRQDVGIVYDLNRKLLSLGPSHLISGTRHFTFTIERELPVLGNDIAHGRRPPG
jgi:hypothetical protein